MVVIRCKVILLDGESCYFDMKASSHGVELFDSVCNHIGLDEKDYFGLKFLHLKDNEYSWLNLRKTIEYQLKEGPYLFEFGVRFYPPDPVVIQGDLTRYLFILQMRSLLANEKIYCKVEDHPMLAAYLLQAEFGDSDELNENELHDIVYFANQSDDMIIKAIEQHKLLKGLTPAEVEYKFLECCKKFAFYGLEFHDVEDPNIKQPRQLAISPHGLYVLNERKQIVKLSWPQILEISYKDKNLNIKCPTSNEKEHQTLSWKCKSRVSVKRIYSSLIDNHSFFRRSIPPPPIVSSFKIGSRHSYSGRKTFKQSISSVYSDTAGGNGMGNEFKRISSTRFSTNTLNKTFKTNSLRIPEYTGKKKQYETQQLDLTISDESSLPESMNRTVEHKFILETNKIMNTTCGECASLNDNIMSSTPTNFY